VKADKGRLPLAFAVSHFNNKNLRVYCSSSLPFYVLPCSYIKVWTLDGHSGPIPANGDGPLGTPGPTRINQKDVLPCSYIKVWTMDGHRGPIPANGDGPLGTPGPTRLKALPKFMLVKKKRKKKWSQ
jgi:hypothetical protein